MRLKRSFAGFALILIVYAIVGPGPSQGKKTKPPCASDLKSCPDEGCGEEFDTNLNKVKNIRADDAAAQGAATRRTLQWIKSLDDPESFVKGGSRKELRDLGEGEKIVVVGYVLAAKPELGGESCNCGLHTTDETDNHLVLVTKTTVKKFPTDPDAEDAEDKMTFHSRELESITAEFTPRVRLPKSEGGSTNNHPNFTMAMLQPLIDDTDNDALWVRVTGLLMFDSEHFLRNSLVRINNWEIHPVLKLEVCTTGSNCTVNSNTGWKSLDDM
jgi:hypothetical protein